MKKLNKKFDYTWVIVFCCFMMVFTALGFCSSPKQLFLKAVTEALHIPRSLYSFNTSFRYATMAIMNILFGTLVYKFKPRKLIAFGFACLTISTLLYAVADNVVLIYLGGIFLGAGLCFTANTMASYVINARCPNNTGTILGFVMASNGLGGALAMQILDPIIESGKFGYRNAYYLVAIILTVVGVLVTVLFKDAPNVIPTQKKVKKTRGQGWEGISFAEGKKKAYFIPTAICLFFTGFVLSGINGISVVHAKDSGLDPTFVANMWSIHSLVLMGSKFLVGFMYDKKGLRTCLLICQVTAVISLISLTLLGNNTLGVTMWVVYAIGSTLALPLETIGVSLVTGDIFGNKEYGKYLGLMSALNSIGFAVGDPVMNAVFDAFGSYTIAIWIAVGVIAVTSIAFQLIVTVAHKDRKKILAQEESNV